MKLIALALLLASGAAYAATEETLNKTFSATSGGTLVVEVAFGSIDVTTNTTSEVAVDVWRKVSRSSKTAEKEYLTENPVEFIQDGNTITVRCRRSDQEKKGWSIWGNGNRNEAKYTIRVPAQFNAKLNTAGGPIGVSDLTGDVKASTSGGALKFARIHGPLTGNTSGGAIRVSDSEGEIKVGTSGGGISVEKATGKVEGNTSGGSINVTLATPVKEEIKLSTSGGGVTVKVAEGSAFTLDASTSGGGVTCDLPVTVTGKQERNRLKGPVNGGGPNVVLRTSGGGIHVTKL